MRRREFIAGLGSAVAWPLVAGAQQAERMRQIGLLSGLDESDTEAKQRFTAFRQGLAELGWADGDNVRVLARWGDV